MKIYEIIDDYNNLSMGALLNYNSVNDSIIILAEGLDEWTAPMLFTKQVKLGQRVISRDLTNMWIRERVIPSGRQNIAQILSNAHLSHYDEFRLLELSKGRCCQDNMYIRQLDTPPCYIEEYLQHSLIECIPSNNSTLLCFFKDGTTRKVDLKACPISRELSKLISNEELFRSASICVGGLFVTFDDAIDLSGEFLYEQGIELPLDISDFTNFVQRNVLDTSGACLFMECSRQNLGYMVFNNQLSPIRKDTKGNLYLKGDVIRSRW